MQKKIKHKKCSFCRELFQPYNSLQKYCNFQCAKEAKNEKDKINRKIRLSKKKKTNLKGLQKQICLQCKKDYYIQASQIKHRGSSYCSKRCQNKHKKYLSPSLLTIDNLWSKLVKIKAHNKCEKCGKQNALNSHHVYSRSNRSTRWDLNNGVCLCVGCHIFSSKFSAHKTPLEFVEWIRDSRGADWYSDLRTKAREIYKPDYFKIKQQLDKQLEEFNEVRV